MIPPPRQRQWPRPSKVMVVESMQRRQPQAGGTAAPAPSFTCGLSTLELVEEFTYLGMAVHARQGFVYAAGPRTEKGRKAKSCMRHRCAELGLQSVPVQLRMFDVFVYSVLSYVAEVCAPQLIVAGNACTATRVHTDFLRSLLGVRRSTPELVVLAKTAQLPLLVRWRTRLARFWNSVVVSAEGSLLQRALADNCALAEEMGGVAIARRPWAGQVAADLASVGVGVSLAVPAAVSVKEVAAAGEDAFSCARQ